eukprot:CAMPEP_0195004102 /NCGR_PEP_ID=MMETSP0326_2-20130528/4011_1 /TAXON_ID=2866 ORGANISM="Crypthecodinium cohnii, Strain Seligo" /NCGR_SAMPLE_ID=MMETSP0326_2 /ASSEMBLY_ACC=CAM_ASM_000348 /LENGTH=87 /DNA_ID=CAMNT_0040008721 /DNA_START=32 /DNA_END=295 /DNA_ORIENTATION=+
MNVNDSGHCETRHGTHNYLRAMQWDGGHRLMRSAELVALFPSRPLEHTNDDEGIQERRRFGIEGEGEEEFNNTCMPAKHLVRPRRAR